jgi:hypothetical protein
MLVAAASRPRRGSGEHLRHGRRGNDTSRPSPHILARAVSRHFGRPWDSGARASVHA